MLPSLIISPRLCDRVEERSLLWQTSQAVKSDGSLPEGGSYSDYLRATRKAEKEDSIDLPLGPKTQTADHPPKPRTTSFFPLRKLKGNQPLLKKPVVHLAHLEEEDTSDDEDPESDDPGRIEGVTEEFMVHLARCPSR